MLTKPRTDCRGFSMIEVLVASSILTVIVMMLGMLFQSTGLAWRTGVQRADAFMQVRGFFGAVQRDLSAAIDARSLPATLTAGRSQQFSSSSLKFFTVTGTGFDDSGATPYRALTYVTYNTKGDRTEEKLKAGGGWDKGNDYNVMTGAERRGGTRAPTTKIKGFDPVFPDNDRNGLPLFVRIEASVSSSGYPIEIGAGSAGPDREWGTKDDIVTWTERK